MKAFVSCGAHGRGAARTKHTLQLIPGFLVAAWLAVPGAMAAQKPLQVFILAGQWNMQGQAKVSTFEHIGMDPATKPMLVEMQNADGTPKVCERVWISSLGSADAEQTGKLTVGFGVSQNGPKIGPEFTFGLYMQKVTDAPILLIKTAWGGKSLNRLLAQGLTEPERLVLEKGVSNLEFHYLGSAKILGGIGKGLAEAMAELKQLKK